MTNRIADLRLEQFEVNQQRDALFQSDAFVAKLEEGHSNEVTLTYIMLCWTSWICAANCSISLTSSSAIS